MLSILPASRLDLRSLALFRILFGLFLLNDIYVRLSLGKLDLAWYTEDPPYRSYLDPGNTPHKAPLHRIWFYRGSDTFQIFAFALSFILSLLFCVGFCCTGFVKLLLFVVKVAEQCRNNEIHDGSDAYSRHLLLWLCFLPVSDFWSLDNLVFQKRRNNKTTTTTTSVSGLACLGLTTQMVLVYLGTVLFRTIDLYGWQHLDQCLWLPPQLSAVHYALSDAFASRDNWLTRTILSNVALSRNLTLAAMLGEFLLPLLCFLSGSHRHWAALALVGLHIGLLACFNLPNWQIVGVVTQVIWIPSPVWDSMVMKKSHQPIVDTLHKKTDSDPHHPETPALSTTSKKDAVIPQQHPYIPRKLSPNPLSLQIFFFTYMLYNWAGNRGWIAKHDKGDIGEGLRLNQYWIMYGTLDGRTATTQLIGQTADFHRIDLYEYIKSHGTKMVEPLKEGVVDTGMTLRYPSPRWERALAQWSSGRDQTLDRGYHFCRALCILLNENHPQKQPQGGNKRSVNSSGTNPPLLFTRIELRYKLLDIMPPGAKTRYAQQGTQAQIAQTRYIIQECNIPTLSPVR